MTVLPKLKPIVVTGTKPNVEKAITLPPSTRATQEGANEYKRKSNTDNKLPPDTYKPITDTYYLDVVYDEQEQKNDVKYWVKAHRQGDLGLPYLDIRQFVDTEEYKGPTKKGINFPLEYVYDLKDLLEKLIQECEDKELL